MELLLRPIEYFLLLTAFIMASNHLVFPAEVNITLYNRPTGPYQLRELTQLLVKVTFSITIIWIMLRLIDFVALILEKKADLTEDKTDNQFIVFSGTFSKPSCLSSAR